MKKIIIEIEDDVYKKLQEMKNSLKHKFKDVDITPEMIAAELITDAVKIDEKLKDARDNMADMANIFGDLGSLTPDEMLNNLNDLLSNLGDLKNKSKQKEEPKKEKETSNEIDEEEFELKS